MRLKSFQAKTMQEALKQVKETLGDDAIIVSTKEEASGWVRITAAIEQPQQIPDTATERLFMKAEPSASAPPPAVDEDTIIEAITDTLLRHRVPSSVSDKIISAAMVTVSQDARTTLAKALARVFTFGKEDPAAGKPLNLVGPPGAGKTLMTAKKAAEYVINGKKPVIVTTDIARAGGVEQLSAFLNIMNLPLYQADDAGALKTVLDRAAQEKTPVIVDTGGLNPFDPQEMKFLARLMACGDMHAAMVMPGGMDAEEAAEIALTFDVLGVREVIPTRLDFARRIGGILSAADRAGLSFYQASHTPQVADGIIRLTPDTLADLLLPGTRKKTETDKTTETETGPSARRGTK